MPERHAILSASSAHRWLRCPQSARINAALPDTPSEAAREGTKAHALAEKALTEWLRGKKDAPVQVETEDAEMAEAVKQYTAICIEKINAAYKASPDAKVFVEHELDYSRWVPEGFGTGDMVLISDAALEVVDFKYGKGVKVEAEGNEQMRLYALGMIDEFGLLYGAKTVRMTIVQPRLDSVETSEMRVQDLIAWIEKKATRIHEAWDGSGNREPGEHCRFCKAKATCRALADYELRNVKEDLAASELTEGEIAAIVLRSASIKRWLTAVEDYALGQALDEGRTYPGLKIVEGRSVRKITQPEEAIKALVEAGYPLDEVVKPQEIETLTHLEKRVGKKNLAGIIGDYITRPKGKPALVSADDKRPAIETEDVKEYFDNSLIKE